jgi:hypothetical protein
MYNLKTRTGYESFGLYIKYLDIVFNMWTVVSFTGEQTFQKEGDADNAIKSIIANNTESKKGTTIWVDMEKDI